MKYSDKRKKPSNGIFACYVVGVFCTSGITFALGWIARGAL